MFGDMPLLLLAKPVHAVCTCRPRHYLFMSAATQTDESRRDEVDEFGNPWYTELQVSHVLTWRVVTSIPNLACTSTGLALGLL
jgi:hypothetical protein